MSAPVFDKPYTQAERDRVAHWSGIKNFTRQRWIDARRALGLPAPRFDYAGWAIVGPDVMRSVFSGWTEWKAGPHTPKGVMSEARRMIGLSALPKGWTH